MTFFSFIDQCFSSPHVALGRIRGGAKSILEGPKLIPPTAIKMTAAGLSTWAIGKLTNSSFISKCSIPAAVVTGVYICWKNGYGTAQLSLEKGIIVDQVNRIIRQAEQFFSQFIDGIK